MPIISVVIPVYNVEKYLARCLDSVLAQDFSDYEVILVNDGATDSSSQICEAYAKKDHRIHLLHKPNGGLSDARNFGTAHAVGEYITYIDSDDYVATTYLSCLYNLLVENNADISCCGYIRTADGNADFSQQDSSFITLSGIDACTRMLEDPDFKLLVAWGKLLKRELANEHPFPKGRNHEDVATTFRYYLGCQKVVVSMENLYGYFINLQGIQLGKPSFKRLDDELWSAFYRVEELEKMGYPSLATQALNVAADHLKAILYTTPSQRKQWMCYYESLMTNPLASISTKLKTFVFMRLPLLGRCYRYLYALRHNH